MHKDNRRRHTSIIEHSKLDLTYVIPVDILVRNLLL